MTLRDHRQAAGLSQQALADQIGLSRQAYGAIEAGRATPGVDVALAIARALSTTVEALFGAGEATAAVGAVALVDVVRGARVTLARIGERLVAIPIPTATLVRTADGVCLDGGAAGDVVQVEPFDQTRAITDRVVVAGCALALGVVADRLNASVGAGRFLWWPTSNAGALALLTKGLVHLASSHRGDDDLDGTPAMTLGRWELGLATRHDDTRVRHGEDLRRPTLRLVHREAGAGAEQLLRRLVGDDSPHRGPIVTGHLDVARAVAFGAADVGICARDAAKILGLRFVPVREERVVIHGRPGAAGDDQIVRFVEAVASGPVRRELNALGYDTRHSGVGHIA